VPADRDGQHYQRLGGTPALEIPTVSQASKDIERALEPLRWAAARSAGQATPEPPAFAATGELQAASVGHLHAVRELLDGVLMGSHPEDGLDALRDSGALAVLLPPVDQMVGFGDGEWRHKDLWKHTKQVVAQSPTRLTVRWAALLHDIGKVKTRSISDNGKVHFLGHAEVGARMFNKLHRKLPLFAEEPARKQAVHFLILHHLRGSQYKRSWTDSAVRRFAREMGAHMDDLFCLSRADITTKRPERRRRGLQQIDDLMQRVSALAAVDSRQPPLPKGLGNAIMDTFGLEPSRKIGDIKRALEEKVESGDLPAQAEESLYVEYLQQHRTDFGL
jgi:poly(A) polymerase